jgi:hypothetical protein
MRYRKLDANGDYTFGGGSNDFLVNTPETVAQAVMTRLNLLQGEWFLDTTAGMPWSPAYFTPSWTAISRQAGQTFHAKLDTDFTASWTAISHEAGQ